MLLNYKRSRKLVSRVFVEPKLMEFVVRIAQSSRNNASLYLGAPPRAALALLHASKALTVIPNRDLITPEDIINMALPVLRHCVAFTPEREMEGTTPDVIIQKILATLEVPR